MTDHPLLSQAKIHESHALRRGVDVPQDAGFALCETAEDVTHVLSDASLRRQIDAIIAVMPEAAWQCMRDGQRYSTLEDFFHEEVFCELSEPLIALQTEWADRLDTFLLQSIPQLQEFDLRPARRHFFFLKIVSDELFMCTLALVHFFLAGRPTRLVCFDAGSSLPLTWDLFFAESVYRLLLPECTRVYGVHLATMRARQSTRPYRQGLSFRHALLRLLSSRQKSHLRPLRSLGASGVLRRLTTPRAAPLLVFKDGYDVSAVARLALAQGWQCREFVDFKVDWEQTGQASDDVGRRLSNLWPQVAADLSFRRPFQWLGVDLWPVAQPRIHYWWHRVIPQLWRAFTQARRSLAGQRAAALLVWSPWGPVDEGILQAGRSLGIPTATYQHGGFEGSCDFVVNELTDLRDADCRFVYGPGVEAYYRERLSRHTDHPARVISVGSSRLDSLRERLPASRIAALRRRLGAAPRQTVVLYVPTMYMRHRRYMACEDYGNVPYFELQNQVVDVMREFSDIRFVYKAFPKPMPDPIIELIAARCPNCRVVHNVRLPELLWAADLHVIDMPSTGLLEALLTPKPIILLANRRYIRLRSEARELLERRVLLTESPDDFVGQLRRRLRAGGFAELQSPNQEFLQAYGVDRGDGCSAERALSALRTLSELALAEARAWAGH